ncbi:MAG: NAD-dependent epimerase/dehydratase family protein [Pseudomonadota bacterium]|nr:NAD-dependent epimerase/dehydratase family protein [Pseudomonadota bacterium]
MRKARIALIGCGAAAVPYVQALRQLRLRPTVFVDADIAAARRLAKDAVVAATPAAVLDRFDAAIVTGIAAGSAIALHELAIAIKPVLCAPEAQAAAARIGAFPAAIAAGSGSFAGSHLRFAQGARRVRALLEAGGLGSVLSIDARFGAPPPAAAHSPEYWDRTIAGGGVLTSPGVDLLDLLAWWLGPLTPVGLQDDSNGGVEAEAVARISTADGASGVIELSRLRVLRNSVVLTGSKGRVELDLEALTVRAEPRALLNDVETRIDDGPRTGRSAEHLHRLRIEQWLETTAVHGPAPDALVGGNAMEALIGLYAVRERVLHGWERPGPRSPSLPPGAFALAGHAVLVAGGTGFIGARLVEMLVEQGANVTVAVRNLKRAARIARLDVRLRRVDLGSAEEVDELVHGQDAVFNLAYDVTRSGTRNLAVYRSLADACVRSGVRRFVHVSSIAVYDDWPSGQLDEHSPKDAPGSEYKIAKRAMEADLGERAAAGALLPTILQPTIVYGPFSTLWTDRFVEQLRTGTVQIPRKGLGHCCGVYVDDVVAALLAAAIRTNARGEAYIVSGPRVFDWAALIGGYADALGRTLEYSDAPATPALASVPSLLRIARKDPLTIASWRPVRALLALVRERIGEEGMERMRKRVVALRRRAGPLIYRPAEEDPGLYLSHGTCGIAKARRELHFTPAVELEEGLERTRDYIRWRYMDGSPGAGDR